MVVTDVGVGSDNEEAGDCEGGSTVASVGSGAGSGAGVGERDGTCDSFWTGGSSLGSSEGRSTAGKECEGSGSHEGCWTVVGSSHPTGSGSGSGSLEGAVAGVEVCCKGAEAGC